MNAILNLILGQSWLHLVSYGLVISVLFVALADAFLVRHLQKALRLETARLQDDAVGRQELAAMIHPAARALAAVGQGEFAADAQAVQHKLELGEAALFIPLRARMTLTRDLSTLLGLIATLLALVAAAAEFARDGKPELLIGSVGTGCVATCVAAIGCAIALWNLCRLTRLRLVTACQSEQVLADQTLPKHNLTEVPINYAGPDLHGAREENHASL